MRAPCLMNEKLPIFSIFFPGRPTHCLVFPFFWLPSLVLDFFLPESLQKYNSSPTQRDPSGCLLPPPTSSAAPSLLGASCSSLGHPPDNPRLPSSWYPWGGGRGRRFLRWMVHAAGYLRGKVVIPSYFLSNTGKNVRSGVTNAPLLSARRTWHSDPRAPHSTPEMQKCSNKCAQIWYFPRNISSPVVIFHSHLLGSMWVRFWFQFLFTFFL